MVVDAQILGAEADWHTVPLDDALDFIRLISRGDFRRQFFRNIWRVARALQEVYPETDLARVWEAYVVTHFIRMFSSLRQALVEALPASLAALVRDDFELASFIVESHATDEKKRDTSGNFPLADWPYQRRIEFSGDPSKSDGAMLNVTVHSGKTTDSVAN